MKNLEKVRFRFFAKEGRHHSKTRYGLDHVAPVRARVRRWCFHDHFLLPVHVNHEWHLKPESWMIGVCRL